MAEQGFNNHPELKPCRRQLRSCMTPAESRLWTYLKGKQLDGRKFRRQHSFGGYILDFYCPAERLAIELDGKPHYYAEAIEHDRRRDAFLKQHGILTLRYVNRWMFDNPEGVLGDIREHFGWWKKADAAKAATKYHPVRLRRPPLLGKEGSKTKARRREPPDGARRRG